MVLFNMRSRAEVVACRGTRRDLVRGEHRIVERRSLARPKDEDARARLAAAVLMPGRPARQAPRRPPGSRHAVENVTRESRSSG